jgi:hypothetical protein
MKQINNRSLARIAVSFSAAALVALGTALPSFAAPPVPVGGTANAVTPATGTTSLIVGGTALTGGAIAFQDLGVNGVGITLDGHQQTPTTTFAFTDIVDATGTAAGWHLNLTLTAFTDGLATPHIFPTSSLIVTRAPMISLLDPTSSPLSTIASGLAQLSALDTGVPIPLFTATAGGSGSYSISPVGVSLNVPASTFATTYVSTATVDLVTGP